MTGGSARKSTSAPEPYDVVIWGAGPAGCATALGLARTRSVLVLERQAGSKPRIGKSLHPDGRQLLADLGLLEVMRDQGHAPYYANRSVWGSDRPVDMDFLRHPHGPGWHLDRARFDRWLRDHAVARGATFMAGIRVVRIAHDTGQWHIELSDPSGSPRHHCRYHRRWWRPHRRHRSPAVSASDGGPPPTTSLACGWVHLQQAGVHGTGLTIVEATPEGWWYTAPLPDGSRVLAFHTDRDLPAARIAADLTGLPSYARDTTREVNRTLAGAKL